MEMSHGKPILTQISKSSGILYRARLIISRKQLNQLYFSFVHSYLSALYRQQKHAIRLLSFKDQFTHPRPLFKEIIASNMYEINIFNILCLMYKCKNKACPKAFESLFTLKPKNKYQKRSCTLLGPFRKSKIS